MNISFESNEVFSSLIIHSIDQINKFIRANHLCMCFIFRTIFGELNYCNSVVIYIDIKTNLTFSNMKWMIFMRLHFTIFWPSDIGIAFQRSLHMNNVQSLAINQQKYSVATKIYFIGTAIVLKKKKKKRNTLPSTVSE